MEPATICPDPQELTRFVRQLLPDGDRERIRDHLDVCDPCRLGIVAGLSARHTEPALGLDADVATGLRLGHFELVRRLGAGGMGVVYEAIDHRLGRSVALKLVRGDHDVPLLDEARAMARIRHPNVLTVYEAGELDGSVYLTTELIPGTTLREVCAGLPAKQIIALYLDAARGLAAAHAHGLVHRDFKPENVLVEHGTRVLVADFGLAMVRAPELARGSAPAGTPSYMAPEQIDGGVIDERADIFAFSVALWEALAGTRPFPGTTLAELRAAMRVTPRLPRHVPAILLRGLAVAPAERPTLAEIIAALTPPRRRRWPIIATLALAAAATLLAWPHGRDLAATCAATPTPAQQRWQVPLAPAWVQHRVDDMVAARDREVVALQRTVCRTGDDDARRAWIACRHDHAIDEAELARALAAPWPSYDQLDGALELPWPSTCASRAARVDAVLPPADAEKIALARARFASDAGGRWDVGPLVSLEAERLLDRAAYTTELTAKERLALLDRAVERAERDGHLTTAARAWLALALARADAHADGVDAAFAQASWAIDRAGDPPMLRARWHKASAARAWELSDSKSAEQHAQAAAALAGDDPHRRAVATTALATAAAARADFATERRYLEAVLPTLAHAPDADAARFRMMYAECLYHLNELALAHREADAALVLVRKTSGEHDPLTAQALLVLGFIQLDEVQPDACAATIDRALEILTTTVGADHPITGSALNLRASARAAVHDYKGALADSQAAVALFEKRLGPRAEPVIFARMQAGDQAKALGDLPSARAFLERALADARVTYGAEDPRTADCERSLATIDVEDHRDADARALLEHALAIHVHAHTPAPYLAEVQAALARLTGDRALAATALAAWRDDPAWQDSAAELTGWLARDRHDRKAR